MRTPFATNFIAACALATCPAVCFAHDGRGMATLHWHARDTFGLLLVGLAALALWFSQRGK
jgi:hypothetical protein